MGITAQPPREGDAAGEAALEEAMPFKFVAWGGSADVSFWHRLADFKLDTQKLTEEPVAISGFFAPCNQPHAPSYLQLMMESLPPDPGVGDGPSQVPYNRNRLPIPGTLHNTNTVETYNALDKPSLMRATADKIWEDIKSGRAEEDSSLLSRFLVVSYADLKKWTFTYRFAFPGLRMSPQATAASCQAGCDFFSKDEAAGVLAACTEWRALPSGASITSFLLNITSDGKVKAQSLKEWHSAQQDGGKVIVAFYDPSNLPANPGWPLRNLLALASVRWGVTRLQVLCYRENRSGHLDLEHSPVLDIILPATPEWKDPVGWELNARGGKGSKLVDLGQSMDPIKLAESAADLNLKLMRWRLLPSLDLPLMASTKCLLLGAGTLGCQVARTLMAWGVRHITLLDYGRVALSNPLRQSLFTHEDSLNNGKLKAEAAAENLKRIFPGFNMTRFLEYLWGERVLPEDIRIMMVTPNFHVSMLNKNAAGVQMSIPMPGHPVSNNEVAGVLEDIKLLKELVDDHDVIFLLTDTRESRWLPTLLCADANKVAINAALGFDTYLVMRHGASPFLDAHSSSDGGQSRLGCYFCNDVVAPLDSTANRTLDQQCTVTRPGLAPIAAALAVELAVALLHHPLGISAPADQGTSLTDNTEHPLGIMPHQVRGFIAHYAQLVVTGHAFDKCTACSSTVIKEFRERGSDFVLEVLNRPNYLEDLTGLTELLSATHSMSLDWDEDVEPSDNADF